MKVPLSAPNQSGHHARESWEAELGARAGEHGQLSFQEQHFGFG